MPNTGAGTAPLPPARDTSGFLNDFGHRQDRSCSARHAAYAVGHASRRRVVATIWETHMISACEPAEERREEGLLDGLGEHAP